MENVPKTAKNSRDIKYPKTWYRVLAYRKEFDQKAFRSSENGQVQKHKKNSHLFFTRFVKLPPILNFVTVFGRSESSDEIFDPNFLYRNQKNQEIMINNFSAYFGTFQHVSADLGIFLQFRALQTSNRYHDSTYGFSLDFLAFPATRTICWAWRAARMPQLICCGNIRRKIDSSGLSKGP